jgi:hypothetical protein
MALLCVNGDGHLTSTNSSNFTTSLSNFSLCAWVKVTSWTSAHCTLVGVYGPSTTATCVTFGLLGDGGVCCQTWDSSVLVSSAANSMVPYNDQWVHLGYVCISSGSTAVHRLYVNGIRTQMTNATQIAGTFTQFYINGYPNGWTSEVSNNQIDNCLYYGRSLSDNEMNTIATVRGMRHGITDSLLAAYEFNAGAESTNVISVIDVSGNGNTLTPFGSSYLTYTYSDCGINSNRRAVLA